MQTVMARNGRARWLIPFFVHSLARSCFNCKFFLQKGERAGRRYDVNIIAWLRSTFAVATPRFYLAFISCILRFLKLHAANHPGCPTIRRCSLLGEMRTTGESLKGEEIEGGPVESLQIISVISLFQWELSEASRPGIESSGGKVEGFGGVAFFMRLIVRLPLGQVYAHRYYGGGK